MEIFSFRIVPYFEKKCVKFLRLNLDGKESSMRALHKFTLQYFYL